MLLRYFFFLTGPMQESMLTSTCSWLCLNPQLTQMSSVPDACSAGIAQASQAGQIVFSATKGWKIQNKRSDEGRNLFQKHLKV